MAESIGIIWRVAVREYPDSRLRIEESVANGLG